MEGPGVFCREPQILSGENKRLWVPRSLQSEAVKKTRIKIVTMLSFDNFALGGSINDL